MRKNSEKSIRFSRYFKQLFEGWRGDFSGKRIAEAEVARRIAQVTLALIQPVSQLRQQPVALSRLKISRHWRIWGLILSLSARQKIKNINVLSGGEKTMTALALICAIIANNPSPFILFDEVDAALDESNSTKFSNIIEELAHKTQFIIITHNRAIMARADVLYGVTMQGDGISRLIGLKLDQAEKLTKEK